MFSYEASPSNEEHLHDVPKSLVLCCTSDIAGIGPNWLKLKILTLLNPRTGVTLIIFGFAKTEEDKDKSLLANILAAAMWP